MVIGSLPPADFVQSHESKAFTRQEYIEAGVSDFDSFSDIFRFFLFLNLVQFFVLFSKA